MRKDIKGYEGLYQIDEDGHVYSLNYNGTRKIKNLKTVKNRRGYYVVGLFKDKKLKTHYLHRLVAEAFVENLENKPQVDHYDGDRSNNHVSNLRWVTNQQNQWNRRTAKGCCFNKAKGKWQAYIHVDGKYIHLGLFDTEEAARAAYLEAKEIYHII
jgi:hypothetical protein